VWITDFLPHELGDSLQPLIDEGTLAFKHNLEASRNPIEAGAISGTA
jgi:hypothetical protein